MSSLRKIQQLSWDEGWLLVQAFLFLPITALAVYTLGVGRWQRALARLSSLKVTSITDCAIASVKGRAHSAEKRLAPELEWAPIQNAHVVARIVRVAAQHGIYQTNCLERSLVLWWLLARRNIECELRFGARKENAQLEAHAWVECCGAPLNEAADVHQRFSSFEPAVRHRARRIITQRS